MIAADHVAVATGAVTADLGITIVRIADGRRWLVSKHPGWQNSDRYAIARLHAVSLAAFFMRAA